MAGTSNSITTHNVLSGVLNADNVISGLVNTAFNPAYALVTQAGAQIVLFINSSDYKMYAQLKDKNGNLIYTSNIIDLPLETMVVDGRYDSNTKKLVLVLDNGNEIEIPLGALISGLVNEDDLEANYYDNNEINTILEGYWTKVELTQEDIDNWNAKQEYLNQGDGIEISAETTLKGNTSQETTTGKNLLNNITTNGTVNGITFTKNSDGSVTANGTATVDTYKPINTFSFESGTSYKMTGCPSGGTSSTYFLTLNGSPYSTDFGNGVTISTASGNIQVSIGIKSGTTVNNLKFYPMVRLASITDDTYEPYTGNQPSPSPDYPQDIHVVSGDNSIEVCGKNLFDSTLYTTTSQVRVVDNTNGVLELNGINGHYAQVEHKFDVIPNQNYVISYDALKLDTSVDSATIVIVNDSDNQTRIAINQNTGHQTISFTPPNNKIYIKFRVNGTTNTGKVKYSNIQLEKSNQATTYEAYKGENYLINLGDIELCKIGDYQDKIVEDNGKWYLNKQIGKVVLDGSENWVKHGSIASWFYYDGITNGYVLDNTQVLIKTNYYTPKAYRGVQNLVNGECSYGSSDGGITHRFVIKNTDYTQTQDFKIWLSTHNTIVYYILATPTVTEITDTTLIEQLDNLSIGFSNNWVKNISQTNADLPFEIEYDNTNLTISASSNLVSNTDYANYSTAGVVKSNLSFETDNNGGARCSIIEYSNYPSANNRNFISKGTLENVITGKELTNKTYVDAADAAFESELFDDGVISIEDSTEANINNTMNKSQLKIGLKGNTSQNTTTGKNLFATTGNLASSIDAAGQMTKTGTGTECTLTKNSTGSASPRIEFDSSFFEVNTTYYISFEVKGDWTKLEFGTWIGDQQVAIDTKTPTSTYQKVTCQFTYPSTKTSNDKVYFKNNDRNVSVGQTLTINNFMISKTNDYDYEPYTGGSPAPNPSYPFPVQVVTGNNSIKVCGKNLLNTQYFQQGSIDGTTGQEISSNTNARGSNYISVLPNTTYTISVNKNIFQLRLSEYQSNYTHIKRNASEQNVSSYTITTSANCYYVRWSLNYNNSTSTTQEIINSIDLMLEKAPAATNYEPYTSQTYPINLGNIELCKIGDYQDYIRKSTGKNLFDKNSANIIQNKYLNDSGVEISDNSFSISDYIKVDANTVYSSQPYENKSACICFYNSSKTFLSSKRLTQIQPNFTTPNSCEYIRVSIVKEDINILQIEKGTQATSYEPYGKVWYLNKQIGKVVLDGSENWVLQSINSYGIANFNRTINDFIPISQTENYSKNDRFTPQNSLISGTQTEGYLMNNAKQLYVRISSNRANTVETFKAWLSTHNTDVYYVLATPTITEITDTTLIEQLNNIEKAYSYDTQTNITQTNDDMPFILDVEAIADNVNGLKLENENQEYKTNKVIELSSNSTDDEYPSAKCVYDIVGNIEAVLAAMDSGSGV